MRRKKEKEEGEEEGEEGDAAAGSPARAKTTQKVVPEGFEEEEVLEKPKKGEDAAARWTRCSPRTKAGEVDAKSSTAVWRRRRRRRRRRRQRSS